MTTSISRRLFLRRASIVPVVAVGAVAMGAAAAQAVPLNPSQLSAPPRGCLADLQARYRRLEHRVAKVISIGPDDPDIPQHLPPETRQRLAAAGRQDGLNRLAELRERISQLGG